MKNILTIIALLLATSTYSQIRKVETFGYSMMQYQEAVYQGNGTWSPYFRNMGESRELGRIEINEAKKTFTIKWANGDDWIGKYTKVDIEDIFDMQLNDVKKTMYKGTWTDQPNIKCELAILKNDKGNCVIELRTAKVIDKDKGINAWKKAFRFATLGKCI